MKFLKTERGAVKIYKIHCYINDNQRYMAIVDIKINIVFQFFLN